MTRQSILAVVPVVIIPPGVHLRKQLPLATCHLEGGDLATVSFGDETDPSLYVHLPEGHSLKMSVPRIVEASIRALGAMTPGDPWTDLERRVDLDDDTGHGYANSIVVVMDDRHGHLVVRRIDGQALIDPRWLNNVIDSFGSRDATTYFVDEIHEDGSIGISS